MPAPAEVTLSEDIEYSQLTPDKPLSSWLSRLTYEIGLRALLDSPADVGILCFQRFIRMVAYGQTTLILTLHFDALDFSEAYIGLFMTMTLLGDVVISFVLTLFADSLGRKRVLILGCLVMAISGVAFATASNYWVLLIAAIIGVVSPNGNEVGPFRAVEESTVAHLVPREARADIYSWYVIFGRAGAAIGTLTSGYITQWLQERRGWTALSSYRLIYAVYTIIALIKLYATIRLTDACELDSFLERVGRKSRKIDDDQYEQAGAIMMQNMGNADESVEPVPEVIKKKEKFSIRTYLPPMSKHSIKIMSIVMPLLTLDAFAAGLINNSWLTYYFTERYDIKESSIGDMFFFFHIVASVTAIASASITKHIGIIMTMLVGNFTSALFIGLIPAIKNMHLAMLIVVIRSAISVLDAAPKQVFLSSIVLSEERTSVMGFANLVRTLANAAGPIITGALASRGLIWVCFEVCMGLKLFYNAGILGFFYGSKIDRS